MKSEWRALKTLQSLANARKSSVINTGKKKAKNYTLFGYSTSEKLSHCSYMNLHICGKKIITTNDHYMN